MDLKKYKVVCCIWNDAHYDTDESDLDSITHRAWKYVSVGILVKSDEEGLTVATDVGEDGKFRGRNFVPRKMIVDEWTVGQLAKES